MTWMTPLEASTSAVVTRAVPLTVTRPFLYFRTTSLLPLSVVTTLRP